MSVSCGRAKCGERPHVHFQSHGLVTQALSGSCLSEYGNWGGQETQDLASTWFLSTPSLLGSEVHKITAALLHSENKTLGPFIGYIDTSKMYMHTYRREDIYNNYFRDQVLNDGDNYGDDDDDDDDDDDLASPAQLYKPKEGHYGGQDALDLQMEMVSKEEESTGAEQKAPGFPLKNASHTTAPQQLSEASTSGAQLSPTHWWEKRVPNRQKALEGKGNPEHREKKPPITHPSTPVEETYNLGRQSLPSLWSHTSRRADQGCCQLLPLRASASVAGTLKNSLRSQITRKAKMLVLLAGIFVVHIATVIMLFVSTIANVSHVLLFIHSSRNYLNIYIKCYKRNLSHNACPL
ncbi:Hypothetical predicted protein [Marmota monax]|uniref:Uncharacterized protein n=1 Tax=Marmota monax TaxID=9995 RepID=A0A5E4AUH4_MARMO|nr:Hypothetical predicted protein [Marmota monax]